MPDLNLEDLPDDVSVVERPDGSTVLVSLNRTGKGVARGLSLKIEVVPPGEPVD